MASPAPVAARAARAFAAPRPHFGGERARARLRPRRDALAALAAPPKSLPPVKRAALRRPRHRARVVTAATAEGATSSASWDNGEDGVPPPAHRGYTPVPGFGEYYVPPAPPSPEKRRARDGARVGPDGAPLPPPPPPPRARSKLLQEPAQAGIWERPVPGTPPSSGLVPSGGFASDGGGPARARAFGDDLRAVRDPHPGTGVGDDADGDDADGAHGTAFAVATYDATVDAAGQPRAEDPELLRLRATYRLLTKMFGFLRYLFPVTGGLACWVAAGASLGGVFATLVPQMVHVVNVLAFALAAVMGGAACLGAFLVVALVGRFLRDALFGNWGSAFAPDAGRAPLEPYDYPTHPGLLAQARAQSEQETRGVYSAARMAPPRQNELQHEAYPAGYERSPSRANAEPARVDGSGSGWSGSGFVDASRAGASVAGGAYEEDPAANAPRTDRIGGSRDDGFGVPAYAPDASLDDGEDEEEKEAFAARAPPKRARVDLPIETLMGLGGETLNAVGSEWQTQRQRAAASAGTAAGAAVAAAGGGDRRRGGGETGGAPAAAQTPRRARELEREQQPPPQRAQARAAPAPVPAPVTRGGEVDWDPDALMQDMGYGAPAPSPAPAPPEKKNGGGWFGGFFGGGRAKEAPAAAPATPRPPPEPEVDPVISMLGGGGALENPNAARAAAAAAKPPSGDYFLSPTQEQSKEQFEEMQKRRDEWNNRVRRAVKRKDEASDEGARDDEA